MTLDSEEKASMLKKNTNKTMVVTHFLFASMGKISKDTNNLAILLALLLRTVESKFMSLNSIAGCGNVILIASWGYLTQLLGNFGIYSYLPRD